MAQNITLLGASYTGVPSILLPKTGGGQASFVDVTDTTATASDVASGKYFYAADGTRTLGTNSGGGATQRKATITGNATAGTSYVKLNNAGSSMYENGTEFSFQLGDFLRIYAVGTRSGGSIYINGERVAYDSYDGVSYNYTLPDNDITIDMQVNSQATISVTDTFPSIDITENGRYDVSEYEIANVNVSGGGGGGGASNIVTGTFSTGTSTGSANSISIPYTGSGYPLMIVVVIEGGAYNSSISPWYSSTQRYAIGQWTCTKSGFTSTPTYGTTGNQNYGVTTAIYKNSTSASTSYNRTSAMNTNVYSSANATGTAATAVRYKTGNVLSYYVASTSYGLLAGSTYRYFIVYSE